MKRRRFLQLAAIAAAGAAAEPFAARPALADVLSVTGAGRIDPLVSGNASTLNTAEPDELLSLLLESTKDGAHTWTIQGRAFSAGEALPLQQGRCYRLRMMNATGKDHCVSLRHHKFEIARARQARVTGICAHTILLERFNVVEADVVISRPGAVFLQYPQPLVIN